MTPDQNDKKVSFLPFHALNEFMNNEYRLEVVRSALNALANLPDRFSAPINKVTARLVKIPGFRNSLKAPLPMRLKPSAEAFEKSPDLVAAILAAWAESHPDLRQKIFDLLSERQWELLPIDADRTRVPGFLTVWPKGESFEKLNQAFNEKYGSEQGSSDDVSLMIVWLSGRLPYQFMDEGDPDGDDGGG